MRHRHSAICTYVLNDLGQGNEHPAYAAISRTRPAHSIPLPYYIQYLRQSGV